MKRTEKRRESTLTKATLITALVNLVAALIKLISSLIESQG